jgi:uncharacterized protein YndB with AHSA1/START domain
VDPVTTEITIARPREEVFEYLADIANHAEFTDHYRVQWHLLREDTYGVGAGARFRLRRRFPFNRFQWADATFTEMAVPRLIVERGRAGKFNRNLMRGVWELEAASGGSTRVRYTVEIKPKLLSDRLMEALGGARRWFRRRNRKALRRMGLILEEGVQRGHRPTIAGGVRKPASAYRFRPDLNR